MSDLEKKIVYEESSTIHPTSTNVRTLKSRHAQMIAIGGTIGTGLFVGSGQALKMGGPFFLLLSYIILSLVVFGVVTATTEMSAYLPVKGCSMAYYGNRFFSRSLGFALGWLYFYIFAITVPAEVTATALVINYWDPPVHVAVWITITLAIIIFLNCFSARVYGEAEFWFASIKIAGILGLLMKALVLVCGGGPKGEAYGFRYWRNPGPMNEYIITGASGRLVAFVSTLTFSVFAFAFAPELLVVTGGEMESPRRNLPIAGRRYFYRLIFFYVFGVFAIGCIVSSRHPILLSYSSGAGSSPWAIAAREAGIRGLDSVINAVIVTSAWSSGNAYLYMSTRVLYSMAVVGNAPKIFARCNKRGLPYHALAASAALSPLAYLNVASGSGKVFNWFANLINTGGFQSWICVGVIYLRFRKAYAVQQRDVSELPFRSRFQPWLTYVNLFILSLLMLLSGLSVFLNGQWNTSSFMTTYLGIPIFFGLFFGHKFFAARDDRWCIDVHDIDLTTGLAEIIAEEGPAPVKGGKWWLKLNCFT
ncbi:proline-specific permease [Pyrenochaeta sp. MPI-SDFR-AT-0127]|nr:proline-specific permease [Pyrenochaeta sp. MPI-SDFR-AT-0127]